MVRTRRANFDWQINLIGMSAIIGLLISYNAAAFILFALITTGIALYFLVANLPDRVERRGKVRVPLAGLLILLTTATAVYFFLTNDSPRWTGKVSALNPLLNALAAWPLGSARLGLNPNVVGAALAALLPLQAYGLRRAQVRPWISIVLLALTVFALLLTQARGAWISLALVITAWLLWRFISSHSADQRSARVLWLAIVVVAGTIAVALLTSTPLGERLLDLSGDRRTIWQNSIDLVGDYPLTGLGLAGFEMAYSTYSLLVHVGHTMHAHNLWIDIWLNMGLLGVIALAGLILNAAWPKPSSPWRTSALLALGVMLLHGLVDDPYASFALPLIFIPLGLLARPADVIEAGELPTRSRFQPAFIVWALAGIILTASVITPKGRAAVEANLGALAQTRAELSVYDWPVIPIQDALRQSGMVDLTPAMEFYSSALAMDPANVTANRRLGQIELARGRYDAACQHFSAALAADPKQRATRQLAGECLAFIGEDEQAIALWRSIDMSEGQLSSRLYWYDDYLADHQRGAQLAALGAKLSQQVQLSN